MTAVSTHDIWAVGSGLNVRPRTLHYDGTSWTKVPDATPRPERTGLASVSAGAGDEVWASGAQYSADWSAKRLLVEHWDGESWSRTPIRPPITAPNTWYWASAAKSAELAGVVAIGRSDAWAVGPLSAHWDGTTWTIPSQPPAPETGGLTAVAGSSPNDVWAVGFAATAQDRAHVITQHWNGTTWIRSPTEQAPGFRVLTDATHVPSTASTYYAVGAWTHGSIGHRHPTTPLIESYC